MPPYLQKLQQKWQTLITRIQGYMIPLRQKAVQSAYWRQGQERWKQLSQRERYMLIGSGSLFLIVVLYTFIWLPLIDGIERNKQNVIIDQENLTFMEIAAPRILAGKGQTKPTQTINPNMFLPTIETTLAEKGMMEVVTELSLNPDNMVSLQFNEVEFDGLMAFLVELRQKYGIQVQEFSATPAELPGFGSATMLLKL